MEKDAARAGLATEGSGGGGGDGRNGVFAFRVSGSGVGDKKADNDGVDGDVGDTGSAGSIPLNNPTVAALMGVLCADLRIFLLSVGVVADAAAGALSMLDANYVPGYKRAHQGLTTRCCG